MTTSKRRDAMLRALCAQPNDDDGKPIGPRKPQRADAGHDRKEAQLCKLAERTVSGILGGQVGDPLLRSLQVVGVEPAGKTGGALRIKVCPTVAEVKEVGSPASAQEVLRERLAALTPFVRSELARVLNRKRVPGVAFVIVPRPAEGEVLDG